MGFLDGLKYGFYKKYKNELVNIPNQATHVFSLEIEKKTKAFMGMYSIEYEENGFCYLLENQLFLVTKEEAMSLDVQTLTVKKSALDIELILEKLLIELEHINDINSKLPDDSNLNFPLYEGNLSEVLVNELVSRGATLS